MRKPAGPSRAKSPSDADEAQNDRQAPALPVHSRAHVTTRSVFSLLVLLLALWVARDFLTSVAWAAVIAITTWPLYCRFAAPFQERSTFAPLTFTLLTGIVILIPVALAARELGREGENIIAFVNGLRESGVAVPRWVTQLPIAGALVGDWWQENLADPARARAMLGGLNTESMSAWFGGMGGNVLHRVFMFFIMLMTLFFLLRDGRWIAGRVLDTADRLLGDPGERLASKLVDAVRGTVNGTVLVAVAEGVIIGAAYVAAGLPNAVILALLTMAFAMVPFGAWFVFTAASVLLVLQGGSPLAAAGVFGFGAIVMLIGDQFVWPALVGGAARLPFLLAFVGILGGMHTFGLIGLFLGPVIMAAVLIIWREWLGGRKAA